MVASNKTCVQPDSSCGLWVPWMFSSPLTNHSLLRTLPALPPPRPPACRCVASTRLQDGTLGCMQWVHTCCACLLAGCLSALGALLTLPGNSTVKWFAKVLTRAAPARRNPPLALCLPQFYFETIFPRVPKPGAMHAHVPFSLLALLPACISAECSFLHAVSTDSRLGTTCLLILIAVHDDIVEKLKEMDMPTAPKGNAGQGALSVWYLLLSCHFVVSSPLECVHQACFNQLC